MSEEIEEGEIEAARKRCPPGISLGTMLKILWGNAKATTALGLGAEKYSSDYIPVILYQRDEERWDALITWDTLRMPEEMAIAHAQGCIDRIKGIK